MKKSERLLQLLVLLRGRRRAVTAEYLAERLEVTERTIYRDMQSLIASGVNIEGEAGVGYCLRPGSDIAPIMFDAKELEALVLGIRLLKGWGDDELIAAANTAQDKIKAVLPAHMQHEHESKTTKYLVPDYKRQHYLKFSAQVRAAIDKKQVVAISYMDEKEKTSDREIECLGLMFWGSAWTIVAWCRLRQGYRLFRLDRIKTLEKSAVTFTIDDDKSFANWASKYEDKPSLGFWD